MKTYLLKWNEPSKTIEGETIMKWEVFNAKEEGEKKLDEVKRIEGATNIKLQETETASM